MAETDDSLRSIVNSSGFLFQIRLEEEVRNTKQSHRWDILASEHRFVNKESEGYIDLVLRNRVLRMVIECKRYKEETTLVFLVPHEDALNVKLAKLLWAHYKNDKSATYLKSKFAGWDDFVFAPASPESSFCVIRGQGQKNRPLLERLGSYITQATEKLAIEEIKLLEKSEKIRHILYFPTIVTNAQLVICQFEPSDIGLNNGEIPQGEFTIVPFVRFRKSLASNFTGIVEKNSIEEINQANERTVLVINASHLAEVLEKLQELSLPEGVSDMPWVNAVKIVRKREKERIERDRKFRL